jgi:hypothetical protein
VTRVAVLSTQVGVALVVLLIAHVRVVLAVAAAPVSEETVHEVAAQLRCVVAPRRPALSTGGAHRPERPALTGNPNAALP